MEEYAEGLAERASGINGQLLINLRNLAGIKRDCPNEDFLFRTVNYLGPYVLYAFDPRQSGGQIMIRLPFHVGANDERPTIWLRRGTDPELFLHFMQQFETVWAGAGALDARGS